MRTWAARAACRAFLRERDLPGTRQFGSLASVRTGDATQGVAGREARLDSPPCPGLAWLRRQKAPFWGHRAKSVRCAGCYVGSVPQAAAEFTVTAKFIRIASDCGIGRCSCGRRVHCHRRELACTPAERSLSGGPRDGYERGVLRPGCLT